MRVTYIDMMKLVYLYECVYIYYIHVKNVPALLAIPEVTALGQSYPVMPLGDIDLYPRR